MGVKGLWRLIEDAGTPVPLETLEHKILAVDVSIWLHQAVRGFRGAGGETVANAHLLTLFHRICKLLFYRIRPVFIFDGGVPHLKKQTISFRRVRREAAVDRAQKVRERLLTNLLKSHAVRNALGRTGPGPMQYKVLAPPKPKAKDMFELPPLPEGVTLFDEDDAKKEISEDSETDEESPRKKLKASHYKNLHSFDLESDKFKSLPLQKRHEILVELQDSRKDNSWSTINEMPSEASNFASYQMNRLLKRSKFQETIDGVRSAIQLKMSEEVEKELFGDLEKYVGQTSRIAAEDGVHSIVMIRKDTDTPALKSVDAEKGKSLPPKNQKDFLTELRKQGILNQPSHSSDNEYDTDSDIDDYNGTNGLKESINGSDPILQVMNYVMEDNNGLTQDEIMSIIQQTSKEIDQNSSNKNLSFEPSTSSNASGIVWNPDASSDSDTDDFIEVCEGSDNFVNNVTPVVATEDCNKNIDAIRSSNSSSLYIKLIQHKLENKQNISPKKAIIDSRKLTAMKHCSNETQHSCRPYESSPANQSPLDAQNSFTVSIDIKSQNSIEDDLFADIFNVPTRLTEPETINVPDENMECTAADVVVVDTRTKSVATVNKSSDNCSTNMSAVSNLNASDISKDCGNISDLQEKVNELVKLQVQELLKKSLLNSCKEAMSDADGTQNGIMIDHCSSQGTNDITMSDKRITQVDKNKKEVDKKLNKKITTVEHRIENENQAVSGEEMTKEITSDSDCDDFIEVDQITATDNQPTSSQELANGISPDSDCDDFIDVEHAEITPTVCSDKIVTSESTINGHPSGEVMVDENSKSTTDLCNILSQEESVDEFDQEIASAHSCEVSTENQNVEQSAPDIDDLERIEEDLVSEHKTLVAQAQKVNRVACNISQQMYTDAQELLQLFGLPYLVAPMEAEAQCAFLDQIGLTNGTITDDSDAFLFGSKHVFKNFFNQNQHVEYYKLPNIVQKFGLDRDKLISLALLTGSDYTEGIEGIGAVSGMELLTEFPGYGIEVLKNFKKWWTSYNRGVSPIKSKRREKFGKVYLPESFPSEAIFKAYIEPTVDESREKFCWSLPNIEALREFTGDKLGWSRAKTDEILIPVMKRLNVKSSQTRIDSFFNNIRLVKNSRITSKRLKDAISRSKGEVPSSSSPTKENMLDKIRHEHDTKRKKNKISLKKESTNSVLLSSKTKGGSKSVLPTDGPVTKVKPKRGKQKCQGSAVPDPNSDSEATELTLEQRKERNHQKLFRTEEIAQRIAGDAEMKQKKQQALLILKQTKKRKCYKN